MKSPIATCIMRCCQDWECAFGQPVSRCGKCGQRPTFVSMIPEAKWPTPREAVRP